MTEPLNKEEKGLVGFSLFSLAMKIGPLSFQKMEKIIDKIGVREEFEFYAKDWIEYANMKKEQKSNETSIS